MNNSVVQRKSVMTDKVIQIVARLVCTIVRHRTSCYIFEKAGIVRIFFCNKSASSFIKTAGLNQIAEFIVKNGNFISFKHIVLVKSYSSRLTVIHFPAFALKKRTCIKFYTRSIGIKDRRRLHKSHKVKAETVRHIVFHPMRS